MHHRTRRTRRGRRNPENSYDYVRNIRDRRKKEPTESISLPCGGRLGHRSFGRREKIEDKERKLPNQDFNDSLHDPEISEDVLPAFAGKYGEIEQLAPRRVWPNATPHESLSLGFPESFACPV